MKCNICGNESNEVFQNILLKKYKVSYFCCVNCGFLQTQEPVWLDEAYRDSINLSDTGYVMRNVFLSRKTLLLFYLVFDKKKTFLDYAGGHGILTRLMRDYGLDFLWYDLYTPNLFAKGFEYDDQKIEAITCFECFEHFVYPIEEIEKLLKISRNIFFSTRLLPADNLPDTDWEYYGFEHGQHISFYSKKTFEYIAKKFNLNYYTDGDNLHFFTDKKISKIFFRIIMFLNKIQLDIFIRKILSSKTSSDSLLVSKNNNT